MVGLLHVGAEAMNYCFLSRKSGNAGDNSKKSQPRRSGRTAKVSQQILLGQPDEPLHFRQRYLWRIMIIIIAHLYSASLKKINVCIVDWTNTTVTEQSHWKDETCCSWLLGSLFHQMNWLTTAEPFVWIYKQVMLCCRANLIKALMPLVLP